MGKPLCRQSGLHQWDAKVAVTRPGKPREVVRMTVFSDTRDDAVRDVCDEAQRYGYIYPTVDHITKIR